MCVEYAWQGGRQAALAKFWHGDGGALIGAGAQGRRNGVMRVDEGVLVLTEEFEHALAQLADGGNLFLTGEAGTGKSTLIRHFLERTRRRVIVAAPTGIAALNVGGYTIHRLFSFDARTTLDDVTAGVYRPQRFAKTIASLDTLIIDEASMVRADLFDMLAAALERFGPEPGHEFGGVQIVLVGDLHQLPPVVAEAEAQHFASRYETPYFFSADKFKSAEFPTVDLTRVFRQSGDALLSSILSGIRRGVLDGELGAALNARADAAFTPPDDEFWLTLAATNTVASARNRQRLTRLEGEEFAHFAERVGELELFEAPTEDELRFKVGAQVMMLTNDGSERWVNGTVGRITRFAWTDDGAVVTVDFTNGEQAQVTAHKWEATRPVIDGGSLRHEVIGTYTQLPFKLAWAITIHKSQGQTLDRMVVDLTGGTFASGQLYVALSRCTSIEGLVLTRPVVPQDLKTDRRILRFLRETVPGSAARRYCAIAVLTVGDESRLARPRPVEIAIAFPDGTAVSTLVNPQRDAGQARGQYGIAAADLLLAPTLAQAWAVLGPVLAGCTPVGVQVDEDLGLLDSELKRLGVVARLPLGVKIDLTKIDVAKLDASERVGLTSRTASGRARAALAAHARAGTAVDGAGDDGAGDDGAGSFDAGSLDAGSLDAGFLNAESPGTGFLLSRDPDTAAPACGPELAATLEAGRALGGVLLGLTEPNTSTDLPGTPLAAAAWARVAEQVRVAAARGPLPPILQARLREAEEELGMDLGDGLGDGLTVGPNGPDIAAVLLPGARVCFTGAAVDYQGEIVPRDVIVELAAARGLVPVNSVTKSKCDALVTAELGSQSGKARQAASYGKPVFSADEFFAWAR